MPQTTILHLTRENMGKPVRHNVRLDGAHTGAPGVTAVVVHSQGRGWCLLADHPSNPGVSVTNGVELYAEAVCRVMDVPASNFAWFELDSDGNFDELHLQGQSFGFAPLKEANCHPRSLMALESRARKLPGGLPDAAREAIKVCHDRFSKVEEGR